MRVSLLPGFLEYVAFALAPVMILLALRHLHRLLAGTRRLLIRLHLWRREPLVPAGPPLEQLAADLRRLYPGAHFPQKGVRMPKQRGVLMAYDDRLVETARALEVPTTLPDIPAEGFDRDAERLRLEHALTEAGLVWQVRAGWPHDPAA
jgi:hypothetical protein